MRTPINLEGRCFAKWFKKFGDREYPNFISRIEVLVFRAGYYTIFMLKISHELPREHDFLEKFILNYILILEIVSLIIPYVAFIRGITLVLTL